MSGDWGKHGRWRLLCVYFLLDKTGDFGWLQRNLFSALLALTASALIAVPAAQTDLPNAYGEQLKNSTFEGSWNDNNEPSDNSWHSFQTGKYGEGLGSMAITKDQFIFDQAVLSPIPLGKQSARISARDLWIAVANGNVTTGQINATIDVDLFNDQNNFTKCFNKTVRDSSEYNTPFTSKPDSVSVWVKFKAVPEQKGRVSIFLHGDIDMQDPASNDTLQDQVAGVAALQFTPRLVNDTVPTWVRLSIPFQYDTYESYKDFTDCRLPNNTQTYNVAKIDPKYIVVTLSTNIIPGGTKIDTMWFDNFLMIYNPKLALGTVSKTSYVKGGTIDVPYTLEGTMSPYNSLEAKNKVILQLSDANGSFVNPTVLKEVETDVAGTISATIPADIASGTAYRVRIVTTNYPMTSADNGTNISISTEAGISSQIVATANISPNPAQDIIEISDFDLAQAEIFNLQGQCVWSVSAVGGNRIDVSALPVGSYILQVRGTDGQVARTKLLINR